MFFENLRERIKRESEEERDIDELKSHLPKNPLRKVAFVKQGNGYIVTVGCQTFVVEDRDDLLFDIDSYTKFPEQVEKDWLENKKLPHNRIDKDFLNVNA